MAEDLDQDPEELFQQRLGQLSFAVGAVSVCIIDPCMGDLLQGFLLYFFFPIMDLFWRICSLALVLGFSALATLHCNSLAGE